MKLTKKIIPALAMLLISAVLMSTASFAWFSMNDTVTATGMTVTAVQQEEIFLEIKGNAGFGISATNAFSNTTELLPVSHKGATWTSSEDIGKVDLNSDSTNDNWYFQIGKDPTQSNVELSAKQYIASLDGYVAVTTYKVKVNENMLDKAYDLYVSSITINADLGGTTVIIAGENGYQEFTATQAGPIDFNAGNSLLDEVTTTEQTITVYIYIDGDNADVTSKNAAQLGGSISFTLKAHTADQG